MPLDVGQTFAGYTIVRRLGAGGMGEVYLAQHPRLPRRDALKLLARDVSADPSFRERFLREADLASTLWHPHIVGVHDRGEHEGQLWIAMDFVDGQDAGHLLAQRYPAGMPQELAITIITDVAAALDYAHKQGLLHRDVKPANIMLTHVDDEEDRRILLTDFGIARTVDDVSGLTTTNMTMGTVAYCAPEQLMGEDIDGRADQYALAATAYHLLTGAQLFPHTNPAVVISRHLNSPPPRIADSRAGLATLDDALSKALAKSPADRYARCADFARVLAELSSTGAATVAPSAPTRPAPAPHPVTTPSSTTPLRNRSWLIPTVAATVVALVVGTGQQWSSRDTSVTTQTSLPSTVQETTTVPSPPPPPPPPAQFPAASIETLLLSPSEITTITDGKFQGYPSGPVEVIDSSLGTSDNTHAIDPPACAGVIFGAEEAVYANTGYEAIRDQILGQTTSDIDGLVEQTVAVFAASEQARSVLTSSTAQRPATRLRIAADGRRRGILTSATIGKLASRMNLPVPQQH